MTSLAAVFIKKPRGLVGAPDPAAADLDVVDQPDLGGGSVGRLVGPGGEPLQHRQPARAGTHHGDPDRLAPASLLGARGPRERGRGP